MTHGEGINNLLTQFMTEGEAAAAREHNNQTSKQTCPKLMQTHSHTLLRAHKQLAGRLPRELRNRGLTQ